MNILFQKFPDSVSVHGKRYRIETDFREWIKLYELFEKTEKFNRQILDIILDWYEVIPADEIAAVRALEKFMAGAPVPEPAAGGGKGPEKQKRQRRNRKPVFSLRRMQYRYTRLSLPCTGLILKRSRTCTGGNF